MTTKLVSLGHDETAGTPARGCIHMAAWCPWSCLLVLARLEAALPAPVIQAPGAGKKPAPPHLEGPAVDLRTRALTLAVILAIVTLAREAGARATWYRDWTGNKHIHLVLDCPCNSRADYQIRAADRGRDGLVDNGPDPHPRPKTIRNHATGLAWLLAQLEEPNMPMPTADQIAQAILLTPITANGKTAPFAQHFAELAVSTAAQSNAVTTEAKRDAAALNAVLDELKALRAEVTKIGGRK